TSAKRDGLPDLTLSAQQAYGTINGLNGLPSGLPGLVATTAGPSQNWNAAFGSLYLTNINRNIFSFGLQKAHVAEAKGIYDRDAADLEQERFQQQVIQPMIKKWRYGKYQIGSESSSHIQSMPSLYSIEK
ncbi:MAG: transporter, partial [Mucilaginibacter sp.]|nr:transporter [Mucilaginibacter sp.]